LGFTLEAVADALENRLIADVEGIAERPLQHA
jgi:hypothetical protein